MRKVTVWIGQKDTLIPADLIPGSIADAVYPRPDRSQAVESQSATGQAVDSETFLASFPLGMDAIANQSDECAVKRLEEERAQARNLREKFPNLPSDYRFSESEAASYLATLNLELVVRRYSSALDPEGRWLGRQFIDSYVSNGAVRARTFPAEVSNERCRELASLPQLYAYDWIKLTGVGIGHHGPYSVSDKGVFFEKWSNEQIQGADLDWQEEMLLDNQTAPDLIFPCTPAELTSFVENAIGLHQFSLPDIFRQRVQSSLVVLSPEQAGTTNRNSIAKKPMERHVYAQRKQEDDILDVIKSLGYIANSIPKWKTGCRGVKSIVKEKMSLSTKVFDLAWERLRKDGRIADASGYKA